MAEKDTEAQGAHVVVEVDLDIEAYKRNGEQLVYSATCAPLKDETQKQFIDRCEDKLITELHGFFARLYVMNQQKERTPIQPIINLGQQT